MGKLLVNKIREINPLAKRGTLFLLALLVSFISIIGPNTAEAAISVQQGFVAGATAYNVGNTTGFYKGTTFPGAAVVGTIAVGAGNDRLLVVAVTTGLSAVATQTCTVTYNAVSMTQATGDGATSARQHSYLFYLPMGSSVSAGAAYRPVVTITGGTAQTAVVTSAVYAGVDQTTVIRQAKSYNGGTSTTTTVGPFAAPLMAITAGDRAVEVVNLYRTTSATPRTMTTWAAGWAVTADMAGTYAPYTQASITTTSMNTYIRSNTTVTAGTNSSHISNGTARKSMHAMVLIPTGVTVSAGSVVPNQTVYAGDTAKVVNAFTLAGSGPVTAITVTGNANTTAANIASINIYRKVGSNLTALEGTDVLIGTGSFPSPATVTVAETVSATTNYIIVYNIAASAIANGTSITFTGAVTALTPAAASIADTGETLTLYPTTTIETGVEPPAARLWKSSAATNMDAFTLQHNGAVTDNDTISPVTVTLIPQYISGGTGGTISKIKLMEIVSADGLTVYGSATAAANGDIWNITTPALIADSTLKTYYVRVSTADVITPSLNDTSGTPQGYYTFTGTITAATHNKANNKLVMGDGTSQTLEIDLEKPIGPASATATTGTSGGQIDLVWDAASDYSGGSLDATAPFVVRRDFVDPDPGCKSGTAVTLTPANQASHSMTDTGLIDTTPTRYYYRVCAMDALGNISDGASSFANAMVTSVCNIPPSVTLAYEDGSTTATMQLIKSDTTSAPFRLQIANNDIGTCPDVAFTVSLANVVGNDSHFTKTIGGLSFPGLITLGTGGAGASTGKALLVQVSGIEAAGAQQLEKYTFGVTVTSPGNSHGAAITTPSVTGLLNDMPPIVHNSANMAKYQYGSWGQTYTCATCHSNSTTNIKGIYQIISTPIGRRNVVFNKTSSVDADWDGVYGNDKRANKDVSNSVCEVCHHQTRQHQYSASKPLAGPGANETYNPDHHNSRDCVKCHTHNTAFRSIYGLCGDCHGFKATGYSPVDRSTMVKDLTNALGPNPPNYGAHARHNQAKITCSACHSNTNHGLATTAWSGNNFLEIDFNTSKDSYTGFNPNASIVGGTFAGTNNLNQPFKWSSNLSTVITASPDYNASCTNYCHGAWLNNTGSNTNPIWVGGPAQAACGTCHNASAEVPPQSGSHLKHALNSGIGLGIACNKCHGSYSNYSTSNAHINGNVEWNLSVYPGATYNGVAAGSTGAQAPTANANYGTCSTLYCHSKVQGAGGVGNPSTYASPKWGDPTTATCGSCHAANPNNSGSHLNHENAEVAFDCHDCHSNGGTTTALNHGNGKIDFKFVGLASNTKYMSVTTASGGFVTPGSGYGVCSSSNCHGRFNRAWGTPSSGLTLCEKCHGSANSSVGFYNTRGPLGTLSVYSAGVGVHDIHIQNPNSPRKATFARFTSYAAGYSCRQCHNVPTGPFTAGHIDTPLPAEVPFSHVSSIANKASTFGYMSTATFNNATKACSNVYCHGAGMNSNRSTGKYVGAAPTFVKQDPSWNTPYLTGNSATDCTKCHSYPPPAPDPTYTHFGATLADCETCHQHLTPGGLGFKNKKLHVDGKVDGGCDSCHGYPPVNNVVGAPGGLATPAQNALAGGAGAHNAHMLLPQLAADKCKACHNGYTTDPMGNTKLEMGFNGLGGLVTTGTFTGYTNSVNGPKWQIPSNSAGTVMVKSNVQAAVCSNVYCHGGGSSSSPVVRPALGGGANTTPNWEVPAVCGDCHGIDAASAPSGGSHPRHAVTISSLVCDSCHGVTAVNGTHVNASVSWHLDSTLMGANATYNGMSSGSLPGLAPRGNVTAGDDYRTCNNVYCHSTIQSGNGTGVPTYKSPRWGTDNGTLGCNGCHANMATDAVNATGSHVKHANTTSGMGVSCGYCHQDGGDGTQQHADGSVFINFTSYIGGTYNVSGGTAFLTGIQKVSRSAAYSTCSTTFCHGTNPSPQWGVAGTNCQTCHSASADKTLSPGWSGRHTTHYNYSTAPGTYNETLLDQSSVNKYRFNCNHCHDTDSTKHSLKPASADSAARIFFGASSATPATSSKRGIYAAGTPIVATDNGFKFTSGSCSTSYCHSNGRGGAPKQAFLNWTTRPSAAGVNCTFCHDGKSATATPSTLSPRHDKHMNPLATNSLLGVGSGYNCVDCHAQVITNINNISIANKKLHVNTTLNYSGARAFKSGYTVGTGSCTTYCHSNGNKNATGTPVFVSMTGSKRWTDVGTITTCNKCHGRSNAYGYPDYANGGANNVNSNLHFGHMSSLRSTTACSDCHRKTVDTLVANKFRPYSSLHISGGANVNFNSAKAYIGTKATVVTAGNQVTCSTVVCHGQGAPVWGASTTVGQCQKCHGSKATAFGTFSSPQVAPGFGTDGTDTSMVNKLPTDPRVGAHQRHLTSSAISAPIKCGECHVTVTSIRSANHWNYSTATLTFAGRAVLNSHSPSVSRTAGVMQCSNVYCHTLTNSTGTVTAPFWNMTGMVKETGTTVAECTKCHAMPPPSTTHTGKLISNYSSVSKIYSVCGTCHYTLSTTATTVANAFTDKKTHINGVVEVILVCNGCHDYDTTSSGTAWGKSNYGSFNESNGAHVKHIEFLKSRNPGMILDPNNDTFGGATFLAICGQCHSSNGVADHKTDLSVNSRNISLTGRGFGQVNGTYNGNSGTSSSVNPKSCSNTDCHYKTSPIWSTY